jgi:hypothetical protein
MSFIQLLEGSIPSVADVAAVVNESEIILLPPAEIVIITPEIFLIVYSLPFPAKAAVGSVIVWVDVPVNTIYVTLLLAA